MRVLMITSEWPTPSHPQAAPFVVRQVDCLRSAGVSIEVFFARGRRKLARYLESWSRIQTRLRQGNYDLIHAQWGHSALLAMPKRKPLVVTFRGSDVEGVVGPDGRYTLGGKMLTLSSKLAALLADEVIVVSEHLGRKLPRRAYHVVPSGLDLSLFRPLEKQAARRKLGFLANQRIVFFGGRPSVAGKRFHLARAAVSHLNGKFPGLRLVAGENIEHRLMPTYLSACDVLLLTSMHEGSPNAVKEALACNLPVVSTDVGDVRERIGSIEGCVVCQDDRPETIASALAYVLARNRRVAGRGQVRSLDERLLAQKVMSIYRKALGPLERATSATHPASKAGLDGY